jgi:putative cardiolipin synthase
MRLITLAFCMLVASCASLPENYEREPSWKLDASGSSLATWFEADLAAHPGQSGAYPLNQGIEALASRVVLARTAEKTLDVQYYIWHSDESGRLLLKEVLDAADRGVRVRLLLDDIGVGQANDDAFLVLDAHPNLSVRLFNPIATRDSRTMGMLSDVRRINHRMHDKSMTADNTLTVVGGRNVGNEYFALDEGINFADLDVFAVGPAAADVTDSFDLFWNSMEAIPISAFHERGADADRYQLERERLDAFVRDNCGPYYTAMEATPFTRRFKTHDLPFFWGKIAVLYDSPDKMLAEDDSDVLLRQLADVLGQSQSDLLIISPYFVPGKEGTKKLVEAVQRGVRVRVATNSLASTDVGAVHAGYKKSRIKLLEGGVELFELMPAMGAGGDVGKLSFSGSSGASLHAKTFTMDRRMTFIGSMNLDPRSVAINTEIGLLIDSPALTDYLENRFDQSFHNLFYTVKLVPKNPAKPEGSKRLEWIEYRGDEEVRYSTEPHTTGWQRFKVNMIGLLPIDSQL